MAFKFASVILPSLALGQTRYFPTTTTTTTTTPTTEPVDPCEDYDCSGMPYSSCAVDYQNNMPVCVCDEGYALNDTEDECLDIDECLNNPCSGHKSVCVNTLGSYKCQAPGQTSNYAVGYGDPHFFVRGNGRFPLCFDFHGFGGDIYTLFYESSISLVVNAVFDGNAHHSWMSKIGIRTNRGNEVLITSSHIQTSRHGKTLTSVAYDQKRTNVFDDLMIEFKRDSHGKHLAFVHVENGPVFKIRVHKDHLGFDLAEPHDFATSSGIVGTLLQPLGYQVDENGHLNIPAKADTDQDIHYQIPTEFIKNDKCLKIASKNLPLLYQMDLKNFLVKSIFSLPDGVSPKLLATTDPK